MHCGMWTQFSAAKKRSRSRSGRKGRPRTRVPKRLQPLSHPGPGDIPEHWNARLLHLSAALPSPLPTQVGKMQGYSQTCQRALGAPDDRGFLCLPWPRWRRPTLWASAGLPSDNQPFRVPAVLQDPETWPMAEFLGRKQQQPAGKGRGAEMCLGRSVH